MLGAGDIKLLAVLGSCTGAQKSVSLVIGSIGFAGIYSLYFFLRHPKLLSQRIQYFFSYVQTCLNTHQIRSYRRETDQNFQFCFTLPILLGTLFYAGGFY